MPQSIRGVPMADSSASAGAVYDFKALIESYILTRSWETRAHLGHYEKDCCKYYSALLAKLEYLLGVRLSDWFSMAPDNPRAGRIYPFFRTTVESLLAIRTPLTGWDEAGFLRDIDNSGEPGQEVRRAMTRIEELSSTSR